MSNIVEANFKVVQDRTLPVIASKIYLKTTHQRSEKHAEL